MVHLKKGCPNLESYVKTLCPGGILVLKKVNLIHFLQALKIISSSKQTNFFRKIFIEYGLIQQIDVYIFRAALHMWSFAVNF